MHQPATSITQPRGIGLPRTLFELIVITVIGLLYFTFFLSIQPPGIQQSLALPGLNPATRFLGLEFERLAGIVIPFEVGLKEYGQLPAWNPHLNAGTPLFNNAFNYLFNPFHSLPVLIFGAVQGSKITVMLAVLLAGWNMWALMRAIGVGMIARISIGALYMMSGGIAAKFYIGHFQLGLSLAWPPLVLAGLWWTLTTTDRRAPVLMAVAFTLLFFTGNIYYSLHTLLCCAVITAVYALERDGERWRIQWGRLRRVLIGGALAFGLAGVQFMPVWVIRDFVGHDAVRFTDLGYIDPVFDSHYELSQALLNYVYPWDAWNVFQIAPFRMDIVVDYAYIGPTVLLFIAALGAVALRGISPAYQRPAVIALVLALVMLVWGAGQSPVVHFLYQRIDLLAQFRYLGRAHAMGALWWLVLAGISIDLLWRAAYKLLPGGLRFAGFSRDRLVVVLLLASLGWGWFFLYSFMDNTTRLQLVFNNVPLYGFLGQRVFDTYAHAAEVLWMLLVLALALEAVIALGLWLRWSRRWIPLLRLTAAHGFRLVLVVLVLTAIVDVMRINSTLFRLGVPVNNFTPFYNIAHNLEEENPFPIIQEPFSPSLFDAYYHQTRNWLLDEGWVPRTLPDVLAFEPDLPDMAGWGIASNEYSGAAYELAMAFIQAYEHERIACQPRFVAVDDPCDLSSQEGMLLYRIPGALPYAFIAPREQLFTAADTITRADVQFVEHIDHQQDTIRIRATLPQTLDEPHYLIVHERNFPGWQVLVDGEPVAPITIHRFVGIPAQPGTHTYTLRYQPPGLAAGLIMSLVALVLTGFYLRGRGDESKTGQHAD